jgi:hypothetical protein
MKVDLKNDTRERGRERRGGERSGGIGQRSPHLVCTRG